MNYEQALRRAISCLRLSQSANKHEAALAAAKAQEIIDRYDLKIDDIQSGNETKEAEEPIKDFGNEDPLHEVCQVDTAWTLRLGSIVARLNSCRIYWHSKTSGSAVLKIVGRANNVSTVRYIFGWLEREVRRITRQECKGQSRRYQIDFRTGVVDTIAEKLAQQRNETFATVQKEAVNPMALVRIQSSIAKVQANGQAVDDWMKQNLNLRQSTFRHRADISARRHGQMAGEQVRFTKARGSIGSPVVAIEN
jgi:hypothetical protein